MEAAVSEYCNQNMNLKWYRQQWNKEVVWVQTSAFMSIFFSPEDMKFLTKGLKWEPQFSI